MSNPQNWQAFLTSACRNYKLRYDEQLLVYAQRPDATAVLEIEQWNKIFGRWVNRGARGIAVFADENRSRQRLTHYFDISDTHESRYSRTVPIWAMRQEYEADVIETLESTFGEIENKSSLAEAIMGAARNAAEDNIPDYLQDLYYATEGSSFEEVEEDIVAFIYKNVVTNSVAYMMMSRLGVDTDGYFELDDFRDVTNFNTQETLNALGFATSDIAEMGLTEISKTITALNRQNRIIAGQDRNEYNKVENNDERSLDNERTDLHDGGRLQPSEPETSTAAGSDVGQIRSDEERVSEGTSQSPLLQSPDEGRTDLSVDDERVMLYDYDMPLFNKEFSRTEFDRKVRENPMNEHLIVKEEPAEERNETEEVQTNMGSMPIEDYREIVASQSGFDSYDEMYHQGYRIGNGYDKEPEPIVPAWEQKKKVKGFDLHPDVPMADRHTFNLRENEVETVDKKERFRRNIMAIQLLKKCQEENRFATPEEQIILSKYVGWGGLSEAFDENNSAWATEYLELSSVLTPEEYASARESTLTAFYTPPEVITAIYKAMEQMGFKEGILLEPSCGIGNFIGMLPDSMQDSKIYGVELDTISAGIAQQLYQKTTIAAQGFEETNLPDSFFDGVVGNVPFGDFKVSDKRYDKHKFLIHDYFFAKSLDKLRPGGVMALVTSKGTMDKETLAVRKYIAQRAELLGAIRLPNNAEYKKALDNVNDRMCRELGLYYDSNYNLVIKKDNSK